YPDDFPADPPPLFTTVYQPAILPLTLRRSRETSSNVSPNYGEAGKEHIRTALVSCYPGTEWVPDVLVTRDESNRRSDRKVVKDLRSLLIPDSILVSVKLRNV